MVEQISSLAWKRVTPGTHLVELPSSHVYVVTREGGGDWRVLLRVGKKEEMIATAKLLWLGKCRAEHHYASLEVKPPPVEELVKKLPRREKRADPDKAPAGEGPRRKKPSAAASKVKATAGVEKSPPNSAITLQLDNQGREGDVLVTAAGEDASLWAKRQGSVSGRRWEVAEGALPYVVVPNSPTLVRELRQQVPGVKLDLTSYAPPAAPPSTPEPAPTKISEQALAWSEGKEGKRAVHVASHAGIDFKILRVSGTKDYALFKQKGDEVQEVACASLADCKAKADEIAAKAGRKQAAKASKDAAAGACGCEGSPDKAAAKKAKDAAPAPKDAGSKAAAPKDTTPAMDEHAKVSLAMNALTDILTKIPPPAHP